MQFRFSYFLLFVLLSVVGHDSRCIAQGISGKSDNSEHEHISDFSAPLDPIQARKDLVILQQVLEEAQTSIYTYSSKKEVDKAFAEAIKKASRPITYLGMVRAIAEIQHTIACGHSSWEHAEGYREYRNKQVKLLPVDFTIIDGRYYVRRNYSATDIAPFTEITHINHVPVRKITAQLKHYMNRDGFAGADNTTEIQEYFKMAYSNFIDNPYVFKLRAKNGSEYVLLPMLSPEIESVKNIRYGADVKPQPLRLSIIDSSATAVYTIMRFSNEVIRRMGQEFVPFTDSVFVILKEKNIKTLVIDLRGNRGGWTANGLHLFSYFIDGPEPYIKRVETRKYDDYSFEPLITEHPGYNDTMNLAYNGKYYEWKNNPNLLATPAAQNRFTGKVYILVDGFTRSASAVFCALMKEHTNARIVGEELTAVHSGTSAMIAAVKLPYSGITVNFSTARYTFAISDSTDNRGIRPHIHVAPTLEHVQGKKDVYLEAVVEDSK